MHSPSRRKLFRAAAVASAGAVIPLRLVPGAGTAQAASPAYAAPPAHYFTDVETAFVEAAIGRIIPTDELGPGAKDAGVADFIDRQLAGPYGRAETWYMQGPWRGGTEQQGWQLKLTPAQLYRAAIRDIDEHVRGKESGKSFAQLDDPAMDALLHALEKGEVQLPHAPAKEFFSLLVQNTVEGFLADPMYGGNRDFAGWKLIGFPGPRYNYVAEIEQFGKRYDMPYVSIAGRDTGIARS